MRKENKKKKMKKKIIPKLMGNQVQTKKLMGNLVQKKKLMIQNNLLKILLYKICNKK
jgi:hypothetical protein